MVFGKSGYVVGRKGFFQRFSTKLKRVKFLLQEAVAIHCCQDRGFELIFHNLNTRSSHKRTTKFYFYGKDFPDELRKSET